MMRQRLGLGGSMDNVIVVGLPRAQCRGLRYDDEFVKHKMLDTIGDMAMVGRPMLAAYSARSGHALNNKSSPRKLMSDPEAYDLVTIDDPVAASPRFNRTRAAAPGKENVWDADLPLDRPAAAGGRLLCFAMYIGTRAMRAGGGVAS